ncbi:MAG: hypothetical protein O2814_00260 [Bacteroidetes bacterium]|nr:hypothetical protein [Bacteroidota bacterium]MDA1223850.1 hypothetical protein [Bacteroidota bacterium]
MTLSNHKGIVLFILFLSTICCYGQYDGLEGDTKKKPSPTKVTDANSGNRDTQLIDDYQFSSSFKDKIEPYKAIEVMTNGSNYNFYLSLDPQAGYWWNQRILLGGGIHAGLASNHASFGGFGFTRLTLNKIFIQGEYRHLNTNIINTMDRQWIGSPIICIGYSSSDDMSSWVSIGLSTNGAYTENMPFGAFIYRFGYRF